MIGILGRDSYKFSLFSLLHPLIWTCVQSHVQMGLFSCQYDSYIDILSITIWMKNLMLWQDEAKCVHRISSLSEGCVL